MRLAPLLLVVLLLAGCGRWTGVTAAKRDALSQTLQELRFPLRPDEAALRLRGQPGLVSRCDRLNTGELRCGGCIRARCFQLLDEQGFTRVVAKEPFTEAELSSIWRPLDGPSMAEYKSLQSEFLMAKLLEQEQRFEPRWGITGGVLAGISTDSRSAGGPILGGRLGARRWFTIHLVGHAAFEYRYRVVDHEVALRVGLELARWTEGRLWGNVGVPPASVSMFIGPLLQLPVSGVSRVSPGLRTGVGVHLTDYAMAPFFVEGSADTTFAGDSSRTAFTFTLGIGL